MAKIITYDTTLRDGEQSEGVILSLEDKLRIARRLDEFGIDIIEGGFPASNPKDIAFFRELSEHPLEHARIAAFGSTCKKGVPASKDPGLTNLVESGASIVAIVGKTWDAQVERALLTSLDENLRMISDSIAFLKEHDREVVFDAEHFFDGFRTNPDYALACVRAAAQAGADSIDLCDTNGGSLPHQIEEAVLAVKAAIGDTSATRLGIHCHNDSGCAVANTLAAVRVGATQVQGTINGYGERVGNADLLTVIADLELKLGCECVGSDNLCQLTSVAAYVAEICNFSVWAHSPYVGTSAFAHKGGLHASAIARFPEAYNHIDPDQVGNGARMLVSELAGKASLVSKAASLGFDLSDDDEKVQRILDQVKEREAKGYSYEVADGSLALLIARNIGEYEPYFTLESFRVIVDDREDTGALAADAQSEATIKIHVPGTMNQPHGRHAVGKEAIELDLPVDRRFVATGEGAGPVGALDNALRMALREFYPQVDEMELIDFKVRLIDESTGTDAITRVFITTRDETGVWGTIGVSENIIEASWNALVESIEYGLMRIGA
ncbi:MAG: citramalate synthase [Eggerthellaceae bacterium]|nr:citramalate synthase [Eggerthellaceae bacterium]